MPRTEDRIRPDSKFFIPEETILLHNDLTNLPYLYNETVVDCLTARYKKDLIYTWAGPILVAVNPVKSIKNLYCLSKIKEISRFLKKGKDSLDPHIYTVAGLAHSRLTSEVGLVNQAILVSGESGAGKTESAKFLLTYLTQVEAGIESPSLNKEVKTRTRDDIQRKILASNPILEAFGNAATLRNYNSSRFGKLIRLQYSGNTVKGAAIDTYLLEKTRVSHQPDNEQNFHIFNQFLCGVKNGLLPNLGMPEDCSFRIVPGHSSSDSVGIEGFKETRKALDEIGLTRAEQDEVFQMVAAVICLGEVTFTFDGDKEVWVVSSSEGCQKGLTKASEYLAISTNVLSDVLTVKKILVTSGKETTVFHKGCERKDECEARRDSLMQLVYASVFGHLVAVINSKISVEASTWSAYLGILDIYGFEAFEENSLEQLCINYANERLQQEFTSRYIASEHRVLVEEGFVEFPFSYSDNGKCVSALDSPVSVFSILNEGCQLRRALDEEETCARVCSALQETGVVATPPASHRRIGFVIHHYAGQVTYTSKGLLLKNKDEVPQDLVGVLGESSKSFVVNLPSAMERTTATATDTPKRRGVRKVTTLSKFKSSLDSLMKILNQSDLHYVRCLKPNFSLVPGHPDIPFLLEQLKSNGILETVKISQAGYPVRMMYEDFVKRYSFHLNLKDFEDKEKTFVILVDVLGTDSSGSPPEDKCRFGRKRIFLSESCLHKLEEMRTLRKILAATCIQKNFKRFVCQKKYTKIVSATVILQRATRAWLCHQQYLRMRESAICIQKTFKCFVQRREFKRTLRSIILLQKYWKGWLCRKRYATLQKNSRRLVTEAARSSSRMSFTSSGYGSLPLASFTDFSTSDAESAVTDEVIRTGRRLLETEESGIETDTESLSGEGHKAGRASRFRTRHYLSIHRTKGNGSDEEGSEILTPSSHGLRGFESRFVTSQRTTMSGTSLLGKPTKTMLPQRYDPRSSGTRSKRGQTVVTFSDVNKSTFPFPSTFPLSLLSRLSDLGIPLFYKDGVMSYRRLARHRVKFHTRITCLPNSTYIPISEKARGLIDAFS